MATVSNKNVQNSRQANRLDFRTTRDGIVPSSIGALSRLTLDAAMKAALTHAGAKLVVELDAGGTRVLLADGRTNQLIGGPDDLQKLGSIRAFVNRERKEAAGVEAAKELTQLTFLTAKMVKEKDKAFEMRPVDSSFGAAMRPLQSVLEQVLENYKRIDENSSKSMREILEPHARRLFIGISNAYTNTISALVKGESIKGRLQEELFNAGVPEWVHARFSSKTFSLERTGELYKLFFPTDPSKGLSLTVKEWRTESFLNKQGALLGASQLPYTLVNDDELIRAITGIADTIPLSDEENPLVAKLLRAKLAVMPLVDSPDRVIEVGAKAKSGFKFPSPSMDTINGAIIALSTAMLRVFAANLQSVDLVGDYYATIVPGAVRREDVTPTNNFYVQWGKAANKGAVWLEAIKGGPEDLHLRQKVWRWLRTELRLSEAAPGGKALAEALLLNATGSLPDEGHASGKVLPEDAGEDVRLSLPDGVDEAPTIPDHMAQVILRPLEGTETPFWIKFQEVIFPAKGGKKRQPVGMALTPITPQGKALLRRVKDLSPYVADRMHSWLRSFSDERLQLAAIKVTNAEFDDIFSSALEEDELEAESVADWAETEA